MKINTRYYQLAGITLQVSSDLPFKPATFDPKYEQFWVETPEGQLRITGPC